MRFTTILNTALTVLIPLQALAAGVDRPSANFTLSQQTMVPGTTLSAGPYSIRVLDHFKDRFIVQIDQRQGGVKTTFIGVPGKHWMSPAGPGVVPWNAAPEGQAALRGFAFGGQGPTLEFVYPKDVAVALAKLNGSQVPAVDPASEGQPAELSGLSKGEMQLITLWLLTPKPVGPANGAPVQIKAEKLSQIASAKPPIARLPHTGSTLPFTLLIGIIAAMGAGLLAARRLSAERSA